MTKLIPLPTDYGPLLAEIKARVRRAQSRAELAVKNGPQAVELLHVELQSNLPGFGALEQALSDAPPRASP